MTDHRIAPLMNRLPANAPAHHRESIETVLKLATNFSAKAVEVQANASLTAIGKADAIRKLWAGTPSEHFSQIKNRVTKEISDIERQRAALHPNPPDRDDAVGEMRRREVRDWLRGLPEAERMRVALETKDELVREAVIHAPAELSGLRPDIKRHVVDRIVQERFGDKLAELDALADGLENVQAAVAIAEMEIAKLPGLNGEQRHAA